MAATLQLVGGPVVGSPIRYELGFSANVEGSGVGAYVGTEVATYLVEVQSGVYRYRLTSAADPASNALPSTETQFVLMRMVWSPPAS